MTYLYQGLAGGKFTTRCSPRTYEEREAAIRKNIEWETGGIARGVERYRNEMAKDVAKFEATGRSAFADSDVGSKLVNQCMKPLVAGIKEAQAEAQEGKAQPGREAVWWNPILCLSAESLAAVVLRTVLAGMQPKVRPWTACCLRIAANIKQQREFELWKDRQFEGEGEGAINLYKVMTARCKRIDSRAARKFMRQSTDLDRLNWDKKLCVHIGMKLMDVLVRYGNGWFELSYVRKGYGRTIHTEKTLRLTEVALQAIEQDHQRCELNRPFLLPMLCEPAEWRFNETKAKSSGEELTESEVPDASGPFAQALQSQTEEG